MKYKYIGECAAGEVTLYDVTFPAKKAVDVTNPALIAKLECNNHFEAVKARKSAEADDQNIN